jgi:Fe-S-cluster-containing dehydrogenase component
MAENDLPENAFRDWIVTETQGVFPTLHQEIRSERCNHCERPPCVTACPTGASHVNQGGTVLVTHRKCTGCKACIAACPYDARYIHPQGYADKCTFCLHRVQTSRSPACVEICPTAALVFGDLADPDSEVARLLSSRRSKTLQPERGLSPQVYFLAAEGGPDGAASER